MQHQPTAGDSEDSSEKDRPGLTPPGFFSPEIWLRTIRHRRFSKTPSTRSCSPIIHSSAFTTDWIFLHKSPDPSEKKSDFPAKTQLSVSAQLIEECIQSSTMNAAMDITEDNTHQQNSKNFAATSAFNQHRIMILLSIFSDVPAISINLIIYCPSNRQRSSEREIQKTLRR